MTETIAVIIPCYNVQKTIKKVLSDFPVEVLSQLSEIICIDNNSTDDTLNILKQIKRSTALIAKKMTIIHNKQNYGYGGSQKIAYSYCLKNNISYFIVVHSDYQNSPKKIINNFLAYHRKNRMMDLIIGSRFLSQSNIKEYSMARIMGNHFFNTLTYLFTGIKLSDAGSAIIFCRTAILKKIPFQTLTEGYHFHPQLNIFFARSKSINTAEIPLDWKDSEVKSDLKLFNYGVELCKILFRYFWFTHIIKKSEEDIFKEQKNLIHHEISII